MQCKTNVHIPMLKFMKLYPSPSTLRWMESYSDFDDSASDYFM